MLPLRGCSSSQSRSATIPGRHSRNPGRGCSRRSSWTSVFLEPFETQCRKQLAAQGFQPRKRSSRPPGASAFPPHRQLAHSRGTTVPRLPGNSPQALRSRLASEWGPRPSGDRRFCDDWRSITCSRRDVSSPPTHATDASQRARIPKVPTTSSVLCIPGSPLRLFRRERAYTTVGQHHTPERRTVTQAHSRRRPRAALL